MSYLIKADIIVGIPSLGAGKMPFKSGISRLVTSLRDCWPDNKWMKRFTVC
jgi:hypothetical protein